MKNKERLKVILKRRTESDDPSILLTEENKFDIFFMKETGTF